MGRRLIGMCRSLNLIIMNGRFGKDKQIGKKTCKDSSTVDYIIISTNLAEYVSDFDVLDFDPILSDIHCLVYAAFTIETRGWVPGLGGLKGTKNVPSPSTCESLYCGEPPWPRSSVLDLRPPGLEFLILCLEDSVNHLTILRRFSWPSLAYMCTKVA